MSMSNDEWNALRDRFAAAALIGQLANSATSHSSPEGHAIDAYTQADAMMQHRFGLKKQGEKEKGMAV